jgi:hypothetical protein
MKSLALKINSRGRTIQKGANNTLTGGAPAGSEVPAIPFMLRVWASYLEDLRYHMRKEDVGGWDILYDPGPSNAYLVKNFVAANIWDEYRIQLLIQDQILPELDAMTSVRSFSFHTLRLEVVRTSAHYPMLDGAELRILRGSPLGGFRLENYPIWVGFSSKWVAQNVIERRFEDPIFVEPQDIIYLKLPPLPVLTDFGDLKLTLTLGAKKDLRIY